MYKDRIVAGKILADKLQDYKNCNGVVLAVPRGGVPIASVIAKNLSLPMELVLVKKIGHPNNKEYAIGAASLTDYFVVPHDKVDEKYIQQELKKIRLKLQEMQALYLGNKPQININGKIIFLVDDGIATGNTLLGILQVLRKKNPKKIIIVVPVASEQAVMKLSAEVDEMVVDWIPKQFYGVGAYYQNFEQVEDEDVLSYLYSVNAVKG